MTAAENDPRPVTPLTSEPNEAGFTIARLGYDPAEVDEGFEDLRTRLAVSTKRSKDLERQLRKTVAEAADLLHRLDSEKDRAAGQDQQLNEARQSEEPVRLELHEASQTRDRIVAEAGATPEKARAGTAREASQIVKQAVDRAKPPTPLEPQWIRGTIRRIVETDAGVTVWVVPEDQPQSAVSIFFTEDDVGREAVADVRASFGAGDQVRVWHMERHGHDIERV
jgi:hypothetical protein